jgi:site-specific DNA-methyltransferase (adenine-specific)
VDAVVTDPPYGLSFMGKEWDHGVPGVPYWTEALRVLKPGGHMLAFGGTRTFHRLACAIEDAGFEIRDCLMWLYGSGFPKSADVSKMIDKQAGAEREVIGPRVTGDGHIQNRVNGRNEFGTFQTKNDGYDLVTAPATPDALRWQGWGTALKPAWEPVLLCRKPIVGTIAANVLAYGTGGINVDGCRIGTGAEGIGARPASTLRASGAFLNTDAYQPNVAGRWPANLVLDEDAARALDEMSGVSRSAAAARPRRGSRGYSGGLDQQDAGVSVSYGDTGGASRYFKVVGVDQDVFSTYNVEKQGGQLCGDESTEDANTCAGKRPESSTDSLPTGGCGSKPTGLSQKAMRFTTETETRSTTALPTCNLLPQDGMITTTNESEKAIEPLTGLSAESASDAENTNRSTNSSAARQEPIRDTARSVPANTCESGASRTATGTMPTCEPIESSTSNRFFYCAKASRRERDAGCEERPDNYESRIGDGIGNAPSVGGARHRPQKNGHPTVKPIALMRWLCRLITPPGGVILDPFCGSGSTGCAAELEGFDFIGIDKDAESIAIAEARTTYWQAEAQLQPALMEAAQ